MHGSDASVRDDLRPTHVVSFSLCIYTQLIIVLISRAVYLSLLRN